MKFIIILLFISNFCNKAITQNFTTYPFFNLGNINDLFADSTNNKLYIGGYIYPTIEFNANGIVTFQENEISPLEGCQALSIQAIKRFNNELYLGGLMYSTDSIEQYTLAKWNGTELLPIFVQVESFTVNIGSINRIEVLNDELYICGGFRFVDSDGIMANGIAKLVDGVFKSIHNFPKWSSGNNSINIVDCITVYKNELYVGGRITDTFPVDTMRHICKWNGESWQMLGNGFSGGGFNDIVDMQEFQGKLYIAGNFSRNNGINPGNNLAVWTGEDWEETIDVLHTSLTYGGAIYCMQVYNDELYIGGSFNRVAGIPASNFAKFDGNEWCTFLDEPLNDIVTSMDVYNNELYIAGLLFEAGGINYYEIYDVVNLIVKLNTSGTIYTCIDVVNLVEKNVSSNIQIYPNPSLNLQEIQLTLKTTENVEITLLDLFGKEIKQVFKGQLLEGTSKTNCDISEFLSGFYVYKITYGKHISFIKTQKI